MLFTYNARFARFNWICEKVFLIIRDLGPISSTFYKQLLHTQIPKAQKRQSSQQCCFTLLGPTCIKAAWKMLMKLTPELKILLNWRKRFSWLSLTWKKRGLFLLDLFLYGRDWLFACLLDQSIQLSINLLLRKKLEKKPFSTFFLAFSSSETKMSLFVRRQRQTAEVGTEKECNYTASYYCHYKLSPLAVEVGLPFFHYGLVVTCNI